LEPAKSEQAVGPVHFVVRQLGIRADAHDEGVNARTRQLLAYQVHCAVSFWGERRVPPPGSRIWIFVMGGTTLKINRIKVPPGKTMVAL